MRLVHWLLGVLFPPKCVLCGKVLGKEELDLCRTCREEAPEYLNRKRRCQFLDSFAAVWYYERNVRRSLLRFKFGGARNYAAAYGRLLAMRIQNQYPDGFDVLTWIPVSRLRKLRRGYDQVELLAKTVGRELGMTPTPLLRKVRHNRPQSGIHGEAGRKADIAAGRHPDHRRHGGRSRPCAENRRGEGSTLRCRCIGRKGISRCHYVFIFQ